MKPNLALTVALALAAFAVPGVLSRPAAAEQAIELRIATLAPSGSSWMKVFNAWNLTIQKETNNTLKLRFYAGGSQGDERDFVRKMRAGQMDGASITTTGLGQLVRQVLVLSVPGVPEVYPALQTRMVDTLPASALAAVSLQWYTRLKYVSKRNSGIIVGATLIRKDKFEHLTDEQKKVLVETGIRAHKALNTSIRRDDDKSYQTVLKRRLSEVDTTEHQAEWKDAGKQVRERLTGRVYPKSLLDAVIAAAGSEQ